MEGSILRSIFTSITALDVASGSTNAVCAKSSGMTGLVMNRWSRSLRRR
ncbi:hypothetical protein X739_17140 [Mesorhizobium sp. LNHC220B00]|nr:hypothetical protein X739_17140 [Mesorhizobium sp. LNHC220B00]